MPYDFYYKDKPPIFNFSKEILEEIKKIIPNGVSTEEVDKISYSKDYMPISLRWLLEGTVPHLPDCITWPESTEQISKILKLATENKIPIIPFGAGSGVLGGAVPIKGGVVVDNKKMDKIIEINENNLTVTAETGINGMNLERELNRNGYTTGHIPQSLYCSCLGGWIACKAAGQFSTKYGKIEDIMQALEAVLPDGTIIESKPIPRSSTGPEVERLFLGSEGTLGIVTKATLKIWPYPEEKIYSSYLFDNIENSLESVRKILRKNVYPAVVRIYDSHETLRHFYEFEDVKGKCMLVLLMEGDKQLVKLEHSISESICKKEGGVEYGDKPVERWLKTRFNVKESSNFTPKGFIFDTVEVSVGWENAIQLYNGMICSMKAIKGLIIASAHASHFYPQGVCFYFTFGGIPPKKTEPFDFYQGIWDKMMESCLENKGSISHHHGIGLTRSKWLEKEMQNRFKIFKEIKKTMDPMGIMNPGKMGLNHESS